MGSKSDASQIEEQISIMREGSVDFYGEEELRSRLEVCLQEGCPLRVKLGMDPSSPDLHLGHTVVLLKLKRFLEMGHTPIFLIGDFTARIGDPSGKKKTRPSLSEEEVQENARTYSDQVARILDVKQVELRFNSDWMNEMTPSDFVRLCSKGTVAQLLERDDFAQRFESGSPIFAHELLYPFVQGYDSVALESDVELGGSDQTFNMLMAREIQRDYGQPPQAVITHPLLVGTDGRDKMSKSLGNSIGITDPPENMYGKVMSLPDSVMSEYFDALCAGEWQADQEAFEGWRKGSGDPMALKHRLAFLIVERMHGLDGAEAGHKHFRQVVQGRGVPDDIPEAQVSLGGASDLSLLEVLVREFEGQSLVSSRSEARRLASQGAISVEGQKVDDVQSPLSAGSHLIRVGKRRYLRLRLDK
jgi:tyrosyl-tRNA synthetase